MGNELPGIREVDIDELYGELRRRKVNVYDLREGLGIPLATPGSAKDSAAQLKKWALLILGVLAFLLVILLSVLTVMGHQVPDLVSGLAGACIGAIAGILSGGAGSDGRSSQQSAPPPRSDSHSH